MQRARHALAPPLIASVHASPRGAEVEAETRKKDHSVDRPSPLTCHSVPPSGAKTPATRPRSRPRPARDLCGPHTCGPRRVRAKEKCCSWPGTFGPANISLWCNHMKFGAAKNAIYRISSLRLSSTGDLCSDSAQTCSKRPARLSGLYYTMTVLLASAPHLCSASAALSRSHRSVDSRSACAASRSCSTCAAT